MFRVFADRGVIGDAEDLESAKRCAEKYLGVPELIWNLAVTNTWWSDEKDGGERVGFIMTIVEVPNA